MKNKLKVLTLILMIALIICSAGMAFAATPITSISTSSGNSATNNAANNISNTGTNNNASGNTSSNTPNYNNVPSNNSAKNIYTNNASTTNTAIPETGAKPRTLLIVLIILTLVSSIYTYAKVKRYNI